MRVSLWDLCGAVLYVIAVGFGVPVFMKWFRSLSDKLDERMRNK